MPQLWLIFENNLHNIRCAVSVLNICRIDYQAYYQTKCIDNNVVLTPIDFFTHIKALYFAALHCFNNLAINDISCQARLLVDLLLCNHNKHVINHV